MKREKKTYDFWIFFSFQLQEISSVPIATAYNDLGSTTIAATLVESLGSIELIQIPNESSDGESKVLNSESIVMGSLPMSVENPIIPRDDQMNCSEYSDGLDLVNYQLQFSDQLNVVDQVDNQLNNTEIHDSLNIDGIYDDSKNTNDVVFSYFSSEDVLFEDLTMMEESPFSTAKEYLLQSKDEDCTEYDKICRSLDNTQFVSYVNWLDSVIETLNLVLDFQNDGHPEPLKFSVPHVRFIFLHYNQKYFHSIIPIHIELSIYYVLLTIHYLL